jgi:hypothetical protein
LAESDVNRSFLLRKEAGTTAPFLEGLGPEEDYLMTESSFLEEFMATTIPDARASALGPVSNCFPV